MNVSSTLHLPPARYPVIQLSRSSHSIRWWLSAVLFAVTTLSTTSPLRASEPDPSHSPSNPPRAETSGQAAPSETASTSPTHTSHLVWWLYASALLLAALMGGGYLVYRFMERRRGSEWREPSLSDASPREVSETSHVSTSDVWLESDELEHPFETPETVRPRASETMEWMSRQTDTSPSRICPECGERFESSMLVCPNDATPLETIDRSASPTQQEDMEGPMRRRCPGCGRRYESEATYCYRDGMRLVDDTLEEVEGAPRYRVCETCGFETDESRSLCPRDGSELLIVAPEQDVPTSPTVPYAICPECGDKAPPGETHCPEDGHLLTPICHAHVEQLSSTGFGPRRKICRECGETYSGAARFCSEDGHELMSMN